MSSKRIHKTLEEIEAENDFDLGEHDDLETSQEDWDDPDGSENFDDLTDMANELLAVDEDPVAPAQSRRRRQSRNQVRRPSRERKPFAMTASGLLLAVGGLGLSVAAMAAPGSLGQLASSLGNAGLTPGLLVMMGVAILAMTSVLRHQQSQSQALADCVASNEEANAERLEYLIESDQRNLERRPASGEELEQVLHTLARQDEKINNITKALKMYGKPLVDVNRQAAETGQRTKLLGTQFGELSTSFGTQIEGIRQQLGGLDGILEIKDRLSRLDQFDEVSQQIEGLNLRLSRLDQFDELARQIEDLGQGLSRLDQIEVVARHIEGLQHQLVQPLGDLFTKTSREGMDDLMKAVEILAEQISADVTKAVAERPADDGADRVIDATKRELVQLSTQMSSQLSSNLARELGDQIQQALANIKVAAPAAQPATGSRDVASPKRQQSALADPPAAPQAPANASDRNTGLATSISGTAKASSKSVMGAIAKLKKMR